MKKLILLGLMAFVTLTYAKRIDGVAVIVEGEAVTTAEIRAVSKQLRVSKKEAREMLIIDRLQKSAMRNIEIPDSDIDGKVAMIASQNNLTIRKMRKILKSQGTRWSKFRLGIKESMKKEKFFHQYILPSIPSPSTLELRLHYKKNKKSFTFPSKVRLIEYSSKSEQRLNRFVQNKKNKKGIKSRRVTKSTKKLNTDIFTAILKTPNGSFTKVFNAGSKYITYKVLSKTGKRNMPFEASRGAVESKWKAERQENAMRDYFDKKRTNANIKIIR
ncbi:MAG: peptidyl-prolyl cis-trans isomerase [Sulfurovum sp.]